MTVTGVQIGVRAASLAVLALGTALAGRRLRASEESQRTSLSLQSALIDSTLDGICLTSETARSSSRTSRCAGSRRARPASLRHRAGAAARDRRQDGRAGALPAAHARAGERSRRVDDRRVRGLRDRARVPRLHGAGLRIPTAASRGRIWTLREVTADRELDRMRDAFVATVSHELRTPLTSISGFLEMMQEEEHGLGETGQAVSRRDPAQHRPPARARGGPAADRADRGEARRAAARARRPRGAARARVEAVRPTADDKGVELELVTDHPPLVRGDSDRLTQVLDNLVSNAVKFTNDGGKVTVSVDGDGDGVRVDGRGHGYRRAARGAGQIFSRFFRASTATRLAIPGTGLGLAISRALIEQHGGTIAFESAEGEGTQVVVTLPSTEWKRVLALGAVAVARWRAGVASAHALRVPGAPKCPIFPATNAWNERVDTLPVAANSAQMIQSIGLAPGCIRTSAPGSTTAGRSGSRSTSSSKTDAALARHVRLRRRVGPAGRTRSRRPRPSRAARIRRRPARAGRRQGRVQALRALRALSEAAAAGRPARARSGTCARTRCGPPAGRRRTRPGCRSSRASCATTRSRAARSTTRCGSRPRARGARTSGPRGTTRRVGRSGAAADGPARAPEGERRHLGLPEAGAHRAQALKTYGMILADNGSNWFICGAPDPHWSNDDLHALGRITAPTSRSWTRPRSPHPASDARTPPLHGTVTEPRGSIPRYGISTGQRQGYAPRSSRRRATAKRNTRSVDASL